MRTDHDRGPGMRWTLPAWALLLTACGATAVGPGAVHEAPDPGAAGTPPDAGTVSAPPDAGTVSAPTDAGTTGDVPDAGTTGAPPDGGFDPGPAFQRTAGWSVHRRMRMHSGNDVVLEEQLGSFTVAEPGATTRIRRVDTPDVHPWVAPAGMLIEDAALHPSGSVSAVLVDATFSVWLARLDPELALLDLKQLEDPEIANDPLPTGPPPPTRLTANALPRDSVRSAADGEEAVVAVVTTLESVLLYRVGFSSGWEAPRRRLVLPVSHHAPFLPIGGSFDTFGAMWSSYRALLDVDAEGNAYLAYWANAGKLRSHNTFTGDGLTKISTTQSSQDSDVLLEKFDRDGGRVWARVVGTEFEDEPYALRAAHGEVAVVGRARRFPGFDNTFWDAFIAVTGSDGTARAARTFHLEASSILLSVDGLAGGGWLAGGSEGWAQNPEGLSVLSFGTKLLVELPAPDADPIRIALPGGPRHNEIRSVLADPPGRWFGGHEDGPVMHTGDGDRSQIHATGVLGFIAR